MTRNYSVVLALAALIFTCGCKKSIKFDSVDLSKNAQAGFVSNPDWQAPGLYGRVVRFDIGDGNGSDCLFAWNISTGETSLTQISSTGSSTLYQNSSGLLLTTGNTVPMNLYPNDCTDAFNEVGGIHVIPYDATGNGHEDHLLVYAPGRGMLWLIHWAGGQWVADWFSTSGIGGYNLTNAYDKIITFDYGAGVKNYLVLYRPGGGITWVMHNNSSTSNPNPSSWTWTAVCQSNSGIGGFDMKDSHDQLLTVGGPSNGNMNLCAYTPAFGYVWLINHIANEAFQSGSPGMYARSSRTGIPGFSFASLQDRMISTNLAGGAVPEDDDAMFCYRPGSGAYAIDEWNSTSNILTNMGVPSGLGYSMSHNPYGSPYTYIGDHIINFSGAGNGFGTDNTSLVFYSNGGNNQTQIYYLATGGYYYQVY